VPKPYPAQFRRDVIAVARRSEASVAQVAEDFGISETCLQRWLKIADREDGLAPPTSSNRGGGGKDADAEPRELRRRNKLLAAPCGRATARRPRAISPARGWSADETRGGVLSSGRQIRARVRISRMMSVLASA
jgi:transposase